jgi:hypothetical protein
MTVQATSSELERRSLGTRKWILCIALGAAIIAAASAAFLMTRPERYEVIQNFPARSDGPRTPVGLAVDNAGHVYGSTPGGGREGWGTIFELLPPSFFGSRWEMSVLSNVSGRRARRLGLDRSGA